MERYRVIKEVGSGTYGNVWQAVNKENGEIVAIKKMKKFYSWEECLNLREVQSLRKLKHPNIVKLMEVIKEQDVLCFVFEYMECSLYEFTKNREVPFSESEIRKLCFQVFQALAYIHQQGYFHRDLKPENLLISKDVIKVADFGLVRDFTSKPPFTEYVSTRWYRAPEVLLHTSAYGPPVDMWAMGAIMAELFNHRPLFPGVSEADEIDKICSVIGSPCRKSWADGLCLANKMKFHFPHYPPIHLSRLIPSASDYALSLISSLCKWDPNSRPTALQALQHPFFQPCYYIPPSLRMRATGILEASPTNGIKKALERRITCVYCEGQLTNDKPANNFSSTTTRTDDAHRKLDMHKNQDQGLGKRFEQGKPLRTWHRQPATRSPGRHGDPHADWNLYKKLPPVSSEKVADIAKKLEDLTWGDSSFQSTRPPPPPSSKFSRRNSRGEYRGLPNKIPPNGARARKVVG